MRSRVMPDSSPTIERRLPVSRLKSVDLPTLGRPTTATSGRRSNGRRPVRGDPGSAAAPVLPGTTDLRYFANTCLQPLLALGKRHSSNPDSLQTIIRGGRDEFLLNLPGGI